jgi:hypothetical protein
MNEKGTEEPEEIEPNSVEVEEATKETSLSQISGRVTNVKGEGINEALVQILEAEHRIYTDIDGKYTISSMPSGQYTLRVIATGFKMYKEAIKIPLKSKSIVIKLNDQSEE